MPSHNHANPTLQLLSDIDADVKLLSCDALTLSREITKLFMSLSSECDVCTDSVEELACAEGLLKQQKLGRDEMSGKYIST